MTQKGRTAARAVGLIALAVLAYLVFSHWVVATAIVRGDSMTPTLQDGDRCLINRFVYRVRRPRRGEVVCFRRPRDDARSIKRIVALPGEQIQIKQGRLWVNDQPLDEPYLPARRPPDTEPKALGLPKYEVAPGSFFVLGDNRQGSADSRDFGAVREAWIKGKLMLVF